MEKQMVQSSNLAAVGYDSSTSTLEVEFLDGSVYQYFGVPNHIHEGLISAGSKGSYFNEFVKRAGYSFIRVG